MSTRYDSLYLLLPTITLLLTMGTYESYYWNAALGTITLILCILFIRDSRRHRRTPSPPERETVVEKKIYLVIGPYVNYWFSDQSKEMFQHSSGSALWLSAGNHKTLLKRLAQLSNNDIPPSLSFFFPFFPDGHDTSGLAITALQESQRILQSLNLPTPLSCTFALYVRASKERYSHDPDRAIWEHAPVSERGLNGTFHDFCWPLQEKGDNFARRRSTLFMVWQWLEEEKVLIALEQALNQTGSSLKEFIFADYGTGFMRHGAWSRWLENNFSVLPGLTRTRIAPPLPDVPGYCVRNLPAQTVSRVPKRRNPAWVILTVSLFVASHMVYVSHAEKQRAYRLNETLAQLRALPAVDLSGHFALMDNLTKQQISLSLCSRGFSFQSWGFSQCSNLLNIANQQLEHYAHLRIFSSASAVALFAPGSAQILPERKYLLQPLIPFIENNPEITFLIVGYTDSSGSEKSNLQLSVQRAAEVRNWLLQNTHASMLKLELKGAGDAFPLASNDTKAGREINRRVDVFPLHPITH